MGNSNCDRCGSSNLTVHESTPHNVCMCCGKVQGQKQELGTRTLSVFTDTGVEEVYNKHGLHDC